MEFPRVFPIFPLESVVLVPGTLLPLHIFEPRYREMIEDTIAGQGMLAMAMPATGHAATAESSPPVHPVVSLGRIVQHERMADGRWNVVLEGVARMRIEQELPLEHAYRRVHAEPLPDMRSADANALAADFRALLDRLPGLDDAMRTALLSLDVGPALDIVLVRLPLSPRDKHAIHADPSPDVRLHAIRRVIDLLTGRHLTSDIGPGDPRLN